MAEEQVDQRTFATNPWVQFLRQYGPIPRNDNMYDESIQRSLRRSRSVPLVFDSPHLVDLVSNFAGPSPESAILTGTAGDGKTFLCRKVWERIGGDPSVWDQNHKVREMTLPSGKTLAVIKDLSELRDEDRAVLAEMAEAIASPDHRKVFLLAANDGQLVEAFAKLPETRSATAAQSAIEELLVSGAQHREGAALLLFNLSRTSAAMLFRSILAAVVGHSGWRGCVGCAGQTPGQGRRCPIWENYERVQQPLFQERLNQLLELCDHNEYHLPIRQLLVLLANTLLGHPNAKDSLLRCSDVPELLEAGPADLASPYRNVFGMNLTPGRRDGVEVFEVFGRFGIGEETSNRIDSMLIFGSDDESLRPLFASLVASDGLYGATPRYLMLQSAYLEGADPEAGLEFLETLAAQRQRLFFTVPPEHVGNLHLWELAVFHFAGEFLQVFQQLQTRQIVPRSVVARLVRGMNRVFSGMLTSTDRQLILATSGSYSQARVSRIEEAMLSVEPSRGQRVVVETVEGRVMFTVYLDRDVPVRLPCVGSA